MSRKLVSRNEDLGRLAEKGYAVAAGDGYLVVRDVPYLDETRALRTGAVVAKLVAVDADRVQQDDHQVFFAGGVPYGLDGRPVQGLGGGPNVFGLGGSYPDVTVERSFSMKKKVGNELVPYADFFDKIEAYVGQIAGPAAELHRATPLTFREVETAEGSVFKFQDTLTSRAEISDLSAKFSSDVVAVIGLGGTGSYLLDFVVKTPVAGVRGFDSDLYHVHNAYRSPGRLEAEELGLPKAEVFAQRYDNFRHGLRVERKFIDADCGDALDGVTFAFVCVDKGSARAGVFAALASRGIPFIDVGMGLKKRGGALSGLARVTHFSVEDFERLRTMGLAELADGSEDVYRSNIQIGELNALNASLALILFKQLRGFYVADQQVNHLLFGIGNLGITGDSL